MNASARSHLMTGVAAVGASAIAIASSVAPPPDVRVPAHQPATTHVVSKATVELLAAVQRMTPRAVTSPPTTGTPAAFTAIPQAAAVTDPFALNAASDVIVNAWNAVLLWIDYGVDLTDFVLGFIPGISVIGNQISIVYYSLVRPVANSFVVDLVAPVVNDPVNINSYVNGLATLGSVTVNSLINLGDQRVQLLLRLARPTDTAATSYRPNRHNHRGVGRPARASRSQRRRHRQGCSQHLAGRGK
jgi:hypothetical protein